MNINEINLSFCIPTYNNSKSIYRLVLSILENEDSRIEVIVLDNGSTDETLSVLQNIDDKRLRVYSNGVNKGALFNMLNVLEKGNGKYLIYSTDHDYVDSNKINKFISFLINNPKVTFGYCEYNSNSSYLFDIFEAGMKALSGLAYSVRHPTGYFFKSACWKSIDCVNKFSDYEFVDLFPLEFIFAEMSLLGDGAIYHESIFTPETGDRVTKHKSATTDGNSKTAFFAPECRLKLAINFEKHIQSLSLTRPQKMQLIFDSFFRELNAATFFYKKIMADEKLCIHYRMRKRNVNKMELLKISFLFYLGYFKTVIIKKNLSINKRISYILFFFSKPKKNIGFIYRIFSS